MIRWVRGISISKWWFLMWALGIGPVCYFVPVGPRGGWQIPADQEPIAFVDNTTLLTKPKPPPGPGPFASNSLEGTLHYWNVESGTLIESIEWPAEEVAYSDSRNGTFLVRRLLSEDTFDNKQSWQVKILEGRTRKPLLEAIRESTAASSHFIAGGHSSFLFPKIHPDQTCDLILYDAVGKVELGSFPSEHFLVSPSRNLVAFKHQQTITVCNANTGRTVSTFRHATGIPNCWLSDISLDDKLLADCSGQIWDIEAKKLRFTIPDLSQTQVFFSPDGKSVIAYRSTQGNPIIEMYDVATGQELVERRKTIPGMVGFLFYRTANRRWLIANSWPYTSDGPAEWRIKLADRTGIRALGNFSSHELTLVYDPNTLELNCVLDGASRAWSPDGRFAVLEYMKYTGAGYSLWEIPPRRPITWLACAVVLWTFSVLLFQRFAAVINFRRARTSAERRSSARDPALQTVGQTRPSA